MKLILVLSFLMLLAACSPTAASLPQLSETLSSAEIKPSPDATRTPVQTEAMLSDLPDLGPAPEIKNEVWLNADQPLRLENLRGKVVLLDMWTFG